MKCSEFTPYTVAVDGEHFPALYSVTPEQTVAVFVWTGSKRESLTLRSGDPDHAAALAAAQLAASDPDGVQVVREMIEAAEQAAQAAAQKPVRDWRAHAAHLDSLAFVGTTIRGKGWKIVFDRGADRTRVIFSRKPSASVREMVKAAGFFWSPSMNSWNKKLGNKAFRAAQALAEELEKVYTPFKRGAAA